MIPHLLFIAPKGCGKTTLAKAAGQNLISADGSGKPKTFLEINCSTIKNLEGFFDQIFIPLIMDSEITVLFDEAHELPKDVTNAFLTIFNTERGHTREFRWRDGEYPFDFKLQTFLFATTEPDKLFPPLKDRLTSVDFEDYEPSELAQILKAQVEDISFEDEALLELAKTSRGNARDCVKVAKEVVNWCAAHDTTIFRVKDFHQFCDDLGINPLGVSHIEKKVLSILRKDGQASLQELCAKTGLSRTAIQRDVELYLMKKSLIKIDGKRHITKEGSDYIDHEVKKKIR